MDEHWVYYSHLDTKEQSKRCKHPPSTTPLKAKVTPSAIKVMASIFWDFEGLLLVNYPHIVKPIIRESYAGYLKRLGDNIKQKRPEMLTKGILFHQVNAAAHNFMVAMVKIRCCGFQFVLTPPYSLGQAPSDFHLFPNL